MAVFRFTKSILKRERPMYHTLGAGEAPDAPTIGTATVTGGGTSQGASISFTPATTGVPATRYIASSFPNGHFTGSSTTSPINVNGSNFGSTKYTFVVYAINDYGAGLSGVISGYSAPSNIVTINASSGGI
jgi:hypothetical protein